MKILHMLTSINTGGAEKFCVDICNTQADISEHEIYLCVLDQITDQPLIKMLSPKITLLSLSKKSGYSIKIIYNIYRMLSEIKPDIIHLNGRVLVYASVPIIIKRIPSVYTVHTMIDRGNKHVNRYYKLLFNYFSALFTPVAISKSVLDTIKKNYGKQFNKIIYNGSSELIISSEMQTVSRYFNKLKADDKTLVFVSIGRIIKVKNTLLLVESFNKLLNEGHNVALCIIGYDVFQNQSYLTECKNKNNYPERIQFVGRKDNIADYLFNADALCLTSNLEGFGIAILEAFSMGIPVLSTPSGGPSEIIISGVNGYVSEKISIDSYIQILKKFIYKPLKNKSKIIKLYNEKYTMQICAKHYISLYKKIITH